MKNTIPIVILFLFSISWSACNSGSGRISSKDANIEFDTLAHDFGEIPFGGDAEIDFVFRNDGKGPLLLTQVKSTCGCTIPKWPHEPIGSDKQGIIHVNYDTHRVGAFTKSVYVYSNASNGVQRLIITGKVQAADQNKSI